MSAGGTRRLYAAGLRVGSRVSGYSLYLEPIDLSFAGAKLEMIWSIGNLGSDFKENIPMEATALGMGIRCPRKLWRYMRLTMLLPYH